MARAATNRLPKCDNIRLEIPTLGKEAAGTARWLGAVTAQAAHDLIRDDGNAAAARLLNVRLQQQRRPRLARDARPPLWLDQEHTNLVLIGIKILLELGEEAAVEGGIILATVAPEGRGDGVAGRVG